MTSGPESAGKSFFQDITHHPLDALKRLFPGKKSSETSAASTEPTEKAPATGKLHNKIVTRASNSHSGSGLKMPVYTTIARLFQKTAQEAARSNNVRINTDLKEMSVRMLEGTFYNGKIALAPSENGREQYVLIVSEKINKDVAGEVRFFVNDEGKIEIKSAKIFNDSDPDTAQLENMKGMLFNSIDEILGPLIGFRR